MNPVTKENLFVQEGTLPPRPLEGDTPTITPLTPLYKNTPLLSFTSILQVPTFVELLPFDVSTEATTSYNITPTTLAKFIFPPITDYYAGIRADVVYEFRMQSHFQQVGALLAVYYAVPDDNTDTCGGMILDGVDPMYAYEQPCKIIPFGSESNYVMYLPWSYQWNYQNFDIEDRMGVLKLHVMEKMRIALGVVPKATIQVWVRLANVELVSYRNKT